MIMLSNSQMKSTAFRIAHAGTPEPHAGTALFLVPTYAPKLLLAHRVDSPAPPLASPFGSLPVSAFPQSGVASEIVVSRPAVSPASWCCLARPGKPEPETVHLTASDWNSATRTCNKCLICVA